MSSANSLRPIEAQTFIFADLSGFTALTEAHGDSRAAALAGQFEREVADALPAAGAEVVKTIGDAAMIRVDAAAEAVVLGLRIVESVRARPGFPVVHVGMHTGPAVAQGSDWFGGTVNIAARVAGSASGNEVVLTEATRQAMGEIAGIDLDARGVERLRNVREPVALYRAVRSGSRDRGLPIDPVCRMTVAAGHRVGSLEYAGTKYFFCSLQCAGAFATEPDAYAG